MLELMPRPSHFIPARMNGLIVGSRVVAACGLHGIMAARHCAILTFVSPAAQPGKLPWKEAALSRGRESLPKAQVLPLEPCGTDPARVQIEMQHCCLSAPPAAQAPLHLLHKIRQKTSVFGPLQHSDMDQSLSPHSPHSRLEVTPGLCFMVARQSCCHVGNQWKSAN